ncbi:hypothetical protein LGV61_06735 [Desulfurispirillum indicum]|uniref:hypothetical protein n=1 Tax=Desulfurispirillum indicum TaxID=936456 RepID=UPI001CFBE45E|nr:hypothetical protein [Desulfurispirillum indicum]UCZ57962.1 hypothetical protein LGV61_06735 [Desulfurispirillum indicum]
MPKSLLKHILDDARPSTQQWRQLFTTDTTLLRNCAEVLRRRYLSNVQLIGRYYEELPETHQLRDDLRRGYRLFLTPGPLCPEDSDFPLIDERQYFLSTRSALPDPGTEAIPSLRVLELHQVEHLTLPQEEAQQIFLIRHHPQESENRHIHLLSLLRIAFPASTIGIINSPAHYQDLCNLTLVQHDDQHAPSVLDDEAYRITRSKFIPSIHWQKAPFSPRQSGTYEAGATLSLRYFCRIISDEDTRADIIRFCNHCLYTNTPRYPRNFAKRLEHEDERDIPEIPH